jgi:5-methyltetrahydrofolate--homocysteine methyltransferase
MNPEGETKGEMMGDYSALYARMRELLPRRHNGEILELLSGALEAGAPAEDLVEQVFMQGMRKTGGAFPRVLFAAHIMYRSMDLLKPRLKAGGRGKKALLCTVRGDLHSIGKNLLKMLLECRGVEVRDLGIDCPVETIIRGLRESGAPLLCLSALLPTALPQFAEITGALRTAGLRDSVKVLIGGALVTRELADLAGADACENDAVAGADRALALLDA